MKAEGGGMKLAIHFLRPDKMVPYFSRPRKMVSIAGSNDDGR
jgi:hypothetical protein